MLERRAMRRVRGVRCKSDHPAKRVPHMMTSTPVTTPGPGARAASPPPPPAPLRILPFGCRRLGRAAAVAGRQCLLTSIRGRLLLAAAAQ